MGMTCYETEGAELTLKEKFSLSRPAFAEYVYGVALSFLVGNLAFGPISRQGFAWDEMFW